MAVKKDTKVTPARVPISNINQFVRIPGAPPTALSKILQEWDDVQLRQRQTADPETPGEFRWVREVLVRPEARNEETQYALTVTEQLYEVGLYTRATKRFGDWMRNNAGKPGTVPFA